MATVKYSLRSKNNYSRIYVKFVASREINYKLATPLVVNSQFFNNKTGKVRKLAEFKEKDILQEQLDDFETFLIKQYNTDIKNELVNSSDWLKNKINTFFNKEKQTDNTLFSNCVQRYIAERKTKINPKTGKPYKNTSHAIYKAIAEKVRDFEEYTRKKYYIKDIDGDFQNKLVNYLVTQQGMAINSVGRITSCLATICRHAKKNGIEISNNIDEIKGFSEDIDIITLSFDEIDIISQLQTDNENLQNTRDWLVIGCYVGQRVIDLLNLTQKNIKTNGKFDFIELKQNKTDTRVSVLIHPKVREVLDKRNGNFPPKPCINDNNAKTLFNIRIKKVAQLAGITEITTGAKNNPKTNRKEKGEYPKYELVTSHICRRSFATNFYGEIPTSLLCKITGHKTEQQFLKYIGKTNIDYAEQMAKYWGM